jgi:hypothetical protein
MQFGQRINQGAAAAIKFHEFVKYLRSEVSKVIGALKIVEVPVAIPRRAAFTGEVPANGKAAVFCKMPQQSELSKVTHASDLLDLHCSLQTYNGRHPLFRRNQNAISPTVAKRSHANLAAIGDPSEHLGRHFPEQVLGPAH